MAVNNLNFGSVVDAWVRKTEVRMLAVLRQSTQRVVSKAQSRIPVDTGFARASISASTDSMPQINPASRGKPDESYRPQPVNVAIGRAKLGDTVYVGWTASYVGFLEHGHSQQAPSGFVRLSAMEWRQIVSEVTAEAKNRAGGAP